MVWSTSHPCCGEGGRRSRKNACPATPGTFDRRSASRGGGSLRKRRASYCSVRTKVRGCSPLHGRDREQGDHACRRCHTQADTLDDPAPSRNSSEWFWRVNAKKSDTVRQNATMCCEMSQTKREIITDAVSVYDDSDEILIFVDLPYACFGLFVDQTSGKVIAAAPIARFVMGWTVERVAAYYRAKGGRVTVTSRTRPSRLG